MLFLIILSNNSCEIYQRDDILMSVKKILLPEKEIVRRYTDDRESVNQLSKEYDVSQWKIQSVLNEHQVIKNPRKLIFQYDESFFQKESPEKYYFFGFSLGDGSLVKKGHRFRYTLTLHKKDVCIIEQFVKWLHLKNDRIKFYGEMVRLTLSGDLWQKDLSNLGLVPHKTYNPSVLQIPNEYIKPFIIGFIDADGSISFNKKNHSLCAVGHPNNMNWLISTFRELGFQGNINWQMAKGKWKRIRIQRKNDILQLAKILELEKYYPLSLKRKWQPLYEYNLLI
jgi:hypothetical protein